MDNRHKKLGEGHHINYNFRPGFPYIKGTQICWIFFLLSKISSLKILRQILLINPINKNKKIPRQSPNSDKT